MQTPRIAIVGAAASLALLGGVTAAFAAGPPGWATRFIEVPPGAVVLVLPAGMASPPQTMIDAGIPVPMTLFQQVNQIMADAQRAFTEPSWIARDRTIDAAWRQMPQMRGPVSGVIVTSFFNGHGTCTQRVTYSGSAVAPKVDVRSTGNACDDAGMPAAMPAVQTPRAVPHTLQVKNDRPTLQVAQLDN
jgi:hypothetical protein